MKRSLNRNIVHRRRGGIYALVMFTSLIVATMGFASVQLLRVQGNQFSENNDFVQARIIARSATEIGMLKIKGNANWRTDLGNGAWVTNQTIGSGTYSLSAVDPIDGDVRVGNNDPIILTATGTVGKASYTSSVRLEVGAPTNSPLEVSMTSASDTNVDKATLTSNQTVSSGGKYRTSGSGVVNADVEAVGAISGTFTKATTTITTARPMPDSSQVFSYYSANGTTIDYSSLPKLSQIQFLTNTTFETDTSDWYPSGSCTLQTSTAQAYQGASSLWVSARTTTTAVASQDLSPSSFSRMISNHQYNLSLPIYVAGNCTALVKLTTTDTVNGVQTFTAGSKNITANGQGVYSWTIVSGNVSPQWSGTLTKATVSISINTTNDYYMDAVSMNDVTGGNDSYLIDRVLLSPSSNPYGATNAQGIYLLQCNNQKVMIGNCRIVGTLVIVNGGNNLTFGDCVNMEPAIANYPVLMTDASTQLTIELSNSVSESSLGVNLNPPGTPYPYGGGVSNATLSDSYPAAINGLIYSQNKLTFAGRMTLTGTVISANQIFVNGSSSNFLTLNYSNIFLLSPPPGFNVGTLSMKSVPGSRLRITN